MSSSSSRPSSPTSASSEPTPELLDWRVPASQRRPIGPWVRRLGWAQDASGAAFSTFVAVHLAAPVVGALAGAEGADAAMLVGRAYYHAPYVESVLVFGSLGVHLISGLAKRALLLSSRRTHQTLSFKLPSPHTLSGYLLLPFALPHVLLHRLIPASGAPPIRALSPSELDYSTFVAHGLARWPVRNWLLYAGVVGLGAWHAAEGWRRVLVRRRDIAGKARDVRVWRVGAGVLSAVVLAGLARIVQTASASGGVPAFLAARFDAVFRTLSLFRV